MSGWRPALRIARRSIRRNLGRSLLVAVLVGLPVAAATMVDVVGRTMFSNERDADRAMGAADAQVTVTGASSLPDFRPVAWGGVSAGTADRDPRDVDLALLLPPGSRVARTPLRYFVGLEVGRRGVRAQLVVADVREPLHRFEAELEEGRAPTGPDEVLISPPLSERLGAAVGSTIDPVEGPPLTVTGLGRSMYCLSCQEVIAAPGSRAAALVEDSVAINVSGDGQADYLVDLPSGASAETLWPELAERGVAMTPRAAYQHPDRYQGGDIVTVEKLEAVAMAVLIAGLGLLEVVLLAGAAFAVGARRQTRELGLVGASGGSARHVRSIVLAQGLVLGGLGALLGVATGFAIALAGRPLWERLDDARILDWAFGPWEIAGAALIGLLAGLAAAVVPAIGAGRMRPVDALAERFRTTRRARRRAVAAGLALIAAGALLALAGDRLLADDFASYTRQLETSEAFASAPTPTGPVALIVGGALLLVAGLVVLAPAVLARLAGPAARMPLALRLAMRDAARHRHRTGPATSAIAVAVAGSVVVAFLVAGNLRAEEARHVPALPPQTMSVDLGDTDARGMAGAAQQAAAELPRASAHIVREPLRPPADDEPVDSGPWVRQLYVMPHGDCADGCAMSSIAVAGDDGVNSLLSGRELGAAERAALAAGTTLVFDPALLWPDGRVVLEINTYEGALRKARLPARLVPRDGRYASLPTALVPESVARERGWEIAPARALVTYDAEATPDQIDSAMIAAERFGAVADIEDGPENDLEVGLIVAALAAAFVTLVGVAISVALSAAEGRADLATLAAVGAPPRRRRALAAAQALLVGGIGCALGVAFGAFVAFTARATTGSPDFAVPWANLGVTMLAVPLLAVVVAAVFTPSRLPLVRRAT